MPLSPLIIRKNAVLLLIDLQKGIQHPKLGPRNNPHAEERIQCLLKAWRSSSRPVVHVRHLSRSPDSVFWPAQEGVEFQEQFLPIGAEPVIDKQVPDAFCATALRDMLVKTGVEQLVIAGVITNNSIEATARSAGNLGFDVLVPEDGCYTFDKPDFHGRARTADEIHAMSLANLQGEYARVMPSELILQSLIQTPAATGTGPLAKPNNATSASTIT